jgi:hypothetical protein
VQILPPEITFITYSTVRSSAAARDAGIKVYYEVEVLSDGDYTQFGFCTPDFTSNPSYDNNGVGDDALSWAVDGSNRVCSWHAGASAPFGCAWRAGDVVGLALDLGAGQMLVSLNGSFAKPHGIAFDLPPGLPAVHAALSANTGRYAVNLGGARAFCHAPPSPDYRAFAAAAAALA